jgi:hypothetical protein
LANTYTTFAALLGVGNSHSTVRRLKSQSEGWHGPRQKTGKALLLPQQRVLMGGKKEFLIDRTQTATWKVTRKQDLGSLTRKIILFKD